MERYKDRKLAVGLIIDGTMIPFLIYLATTYDMLMVNTSILQIYHF
jgi:hypothetical protein